MDSYKTVLYSTFDSFIEKRSRFIGYVKPVKTEEEAVSFINEIKSKHWDATHNVYAYALRQGQTRRYSDDGEPQGTAGIPVLDVILKEGLTDICVVVTRYFGGVLLGTGGLVRAYSHSAKIGIDKAQVIQMSLCYEALLKCDYTLYGKLNSLIPENGGIIDKTDFTDCVEIYFTLPTENLPMFDKKLTDLSCGRLKTEVLNEKYAQIG